MKYLTIIASSIILMSSYIFTAEHPRPTEEYPRQGKLTRQQAFRKKNPQSFIIILHNESHYDISTESLVISPGESKKIQLPEDLNLKVSFCALKDSLTLDFKLSVPQNVYFTEKSDLVELFYDEVLIKKYIL